MIDQPTYNPSRLSPLTIPFPPLGRFRRLAHPYERATGALHVLMGVDHLCALAVVAAPAESDVKSAERAEDVRDATSSPSSPDARGGTTEHLPTHLAVFLKSLALGIRWGLGHAAGLALVCAVFFPAKGRISLDGVGEVADKIVGASMVFLGAMALAQLRAWRRRRALERAHLDDALGNAASDLQPHAEGRWLDLEAQRDAALAKTSRLETERPRRSPPSPLTVRPGSAAHAYAHDLDLPHVHRVEGAGAPRADETVAEQPETPALVSSDGVDEGIDRRATRGADAQDAGVEREKEKTASETRARWSFAIGFSHGIASPSGILSVLPAAVLDDSAKASAYLVAFFLTSTASMGAFAGAFGLVASLAAAAAAAAAPGRDPVRRVSDAPVRVAMGLNLFAGVAAVAIGVAWLVLSATGKLGDL